MKTASVALQNFFQSVMNETVASYWYADLYTVTRLDGIVSRWSTWGLPLTVGGHLFTPFGPFVKRSSIGWATGLENTQMKIRLMANPSMMIGPSANIIPIIQSLCQDLFANATVRVDRLIMATPGDLTLGTYNLWLGKVGDVEVARSHADISVESGLVVLNTQTPRTVYGPSCRHVFGNLNCTINLASYTTAGIVGSSPNRFQIATNLTPPGTINPPSSAPTLSQSFDPNAALPARQYWVVITYISVLGETIASSESTIVINPNNVVTVASPPPATGALYWNCYISENPGNEQRQNLNLLAIGSDFVEPSVGTTTGSPPPLSSVSGYYALGVLTFTSGVNTGLARQVQGNSGGTLTFSSGFPQSPAPGDTFDIVSGCDRTLTTCQQKYNNLINFGGQPFIPQPENAI